MKLKDNASCRRNTRLKLVTRLFDSVNRVPTFVGGWRPRGAVVQSRVGSLTISWGIDRHKITQDVVMIYYQIFSHSIMRIIWTKVRCPKPSK